jgi:ferredoxin
MVAVMVAGRLRRERDMRRPDTMYIEWTRCIHCELCYEIAPAIRADPERIAISAPALDAMAACPTGALVWREERDGRPSDP